MTTLILNFDDREPLTKDYEKALFKAITHRLLSDLPYGRMHNLHTLDTIRTTYDLMYDKIIFFYNEKKYKINFSKNQKKHGKLIEVDKEKKNAHFNLILDLTDIEKTAQKSLATGISIDTALTEWQQIKNERLFLSEGFKLKPVHILTDMILAEMTAEQKKCKPYNQLFLGKLEAEGYSWTKKVIDTQTFTLYGNFIAEDFLITYDIPHNPVNFLKAYAKDMMRFLVTHLVENGNDVKVTINYLEDATPPR